MPTAFVSKSSKGREAARSWLGCAAAWTMASGRSSSINRSTPGAVANVQFVVREPLAGAFQPLLVPARVALRAEEIGPHVVVHAMHVPAQSVEMLGHFRADQLRWNRLPRVSLGILLDVFGKRRRRVYDLALVRDPIGFGRGVEVDDSIVPGSDKRTTSLPPNSTAVLPETPVSRLNSRKLVPASARCERRRASRRRETSGRSRRKEIETPGRREIDGDGRRAVRLRLDVQGRE